MNTQLVEIPNGRGDLLRGILTACAHPSFGVVMIGGFERSATTEMKFKSLADAVAPCGGACLRLDAAGQGLSDGDYGRLTVAGMADDFAAAAASLRQHFSFARVSGVGHSLGGCVVAAAWEQAGLDRAVLIAPAINQADLLRYYYAKQVCQATPVTWENFRELITEDGFLASTEQGTVTASHNIANAYFIENRAADYRPLIAVRGDRVLIAHGYADPKVPLASLGAMPGNRLFVVPHGDHDLERPGHFERWFSEAVAFLAT